MVTRVEEYPSLQSVKISSNWADAFPCLGLRAQRGTSAFPDGTQRSASPVDALEKELFEALIA